MGLPIERGWIKRWIENNLFMVTGINFVVRPASALISEIFSNAELGRSSNFEMRSTILV